MAEAARHDDRPRTIEEWADLDEDEPGELVDGRLVEEEMAGWGHEVVVAWLLAVLHAWARGAGARVVASELKMAVSSTRGRKADLVVHLAGDPRPPRRGAVRVPPSIAIEVISPRPSDARRDRLEKLADYETFGIRFYWLVDPELRTFELFERGTTGRYVRAVGASAGVIDEVPGCPGLRVDLDAMWADLDAALAESSDERS